MTEIVERLQEVFKDAEDITDPSNMDKVLFILEENLMADEDYMQLLVEKLNMETITWPQPWYQMSTCLTRKPKEPGGDYEKYETGSFTQKECKRVRKNWKKFVKSFELPNTPVCLARWRNRNKSRTIMKSKEEFVRYFVTAYLAKGLERDLYQVNRHFLQTYAYPNKLKSYTPVEEKIMEICFYQSPRNAVKILSSVLGREPRGIYTRLFKYYNGEPEKKRLKWTLDLATKFLKSLLLHSGCSLEELKNKKFDPAVWRKVGEDMGQEYRHLQSFWYGKLHVQIFTQCIVKIKTLRNIICMLLKESPYKVWIDIRWRDLVQKFPDGITPQFLNIVARYIFRKYPNYLTRPLPEVIAEVEVNNMKKKRNKRLKCVQYNAEGNLKYVQYKENLHDIMFN